MRAARAMMGVVGAVGAVGMVGAMGGKSLGKLLPLSSYLLATSYLLEFKGLFWVAVH